MFNMTRVNVDFNSIRPINGSKADGFEEFVCQLAKRENDIGRAGIFIRNGKPDAGVECYCILPNGNICAWQAKYFRESLGKTQFNQIERSLNTALVNKKIVKYYIAIPIDPSSTRSGKSMREKWDGYIRKWKGIYPNTEIIALWHSDLISLLEKPQNLTMLKFWFDKTFLDDDWFSNQNKYSICDLGPRYSPEINVELNCSMIFDGLELNNKILNLYLEKLLLLSKEFHDLLKYNDKKDSRLTDVELSIKNLMGLDRYKIEGKDDKKIDFRSARKCLSDIEEQIINFQKNFDTYDNLISFKKNQNFSEDYNLKVCLRRFQNTFDDLLYFVNSIAVKLYDDPYLLLTGDAGIGKSHQIAHYIGKRTEKGLKSVLLLGQKFKELKSPNIQILNQLDLKCTFEEFLEALNCKAEIDGERIIIFIDAINEGKGYELWKDNINGLISQIRKYTNLGLVLSLRSTYSEIFHEPLKEMHEYKLKGFYGLTYEAIKIFFNYYKINFPTIPLLSSEFSNPLFLKLLCEGIHKKGIKQIGDKIFHIDNIFEFYLKALNVKIFHDNYKLNPLDKIIDALIDEQIMNGYKTEFTYESIARITKDIYSEYDPTINPWKELIREGLLFEDCFGKNVYVRFSYERLNDFLLAKRIVASEKLPNLRYLLKAIRCPDLYQGIYDAIAILLPKYKGKEIFEYLLSPRLERVVAKAFLNSLIWRKSNSINGKSLEFINNTIIPKYHDMFLEILIISSLNPCSVVNANKCHEYLMSLSLPVRDSTWTIFLCDTYKYDDNPISRLLDWVFYQNDWSAVQDDIIELSSIMLSWFLVSQNRKLRDTATKALVFMLEGRPNIMIKILKKFDGVNDPYVAERLYAVAYGVSLRAKDVTFLQDLSDYIYRAIFNKEKVYPHILLRDYACGVIEYAIAKGIQLEIPVSKIKPPYKSNFPEIPSDDEVKKYDVKSNDIKKNHSLCSIRYIIDSMRVEYPRDGSICTYGDFGRYIFQNALSDFEHDHSNTQDFISDMHNIALKRIFELGYNAEIHGYFDIRIKSENRGVPMVERIGKKYQWIAFHELLAFLADKYKIRNNTWGAEDSPRSYSGPWDLYVRDIDPSYIGKFSSEKYVSETKYSNWNKNYVAWLKENDDFPDPVSIIKGKCDEWLLLNGHLHWEEPKTILIEKYNPASSLLFYHFNVYFVDAKEKKGLLAWLKQKDFFGRWLPELNYPSKMFIREYLWRSKRMDENHDTDRCYFTDNYAIASNDKIANGFYSTSNYYSCYNSQDFSLEKNEQGIPKPCKMLFDFFGLHHKEYENLLYDVDNNLVCISNKHNLYIKRDKLLEFLNKKNLTIIWALLAEKQIYSEKKPNTNTLSGVYYLSSRNGDIIGNTKYSLGPSSKKDTIS